MNVRDIKRVVVALDGETNSQRALPVAIEVANQLDAPIALLSSVTSVEERLFRLRQLEEISEQLERSGLPTDTDVALTDDVAQPIEAAADDETLIVMATSAKIGLHDGHVGSIASRVVRHVDHPVLLVGPQADGDMSISRIVVPVDGSAASAHALEPAAGWAVLLDVPLWVVTVVTPDLQSAAAGAGVTAEHGYVRRLAQQVPDGIDSEFEVLHGDDVVTGLRDFIGADGLCVMTTTGKSGIRRLVMGSVASGVVRLSPKPVLVVRVRS